MTTEQDAHDAAVETIWTAINGEISAAESIAYIHGWEYKGERGPDGRSKRITEAIRTELEAAAAQSRPELPTYSWN